MTKKKIRLLIAEDEVIIAQCLTIELELEGYEVCKYVATGEEAVIETAKAKPDAVLMDINLTGEIDGIEAAKEIIRNNNVPIIFMTGFTESNIFKKAQELNPVAYLEKPVEVYDITPILEKLFS